MSVGMLFSVGLFGCGREKAIPLPEPEPEITASPELEAEKFKGTARFGSQCAFGTFAPTQEVPIELWKCPTGLPLVELQEPLAPLILQADCKKKTLDVRGEPRSLNATTWEVMPDGSFYFSIPAGSAILKQDGAGTAECSVPLKADLWGRIDCTDRDKAKIRVETVWWLGKSPHEAGAPNTTSPSASPSPGPSSSPSMIPQPPARPSLSASGRRAYAFPSSPSVPAPSVPSPYSPSTPEEDDSPTSTPSALPSPAPSKTPPPCRIPEGCYFHNISKIDQCS